MRIVDDAAARILARRRLVRRLRAGGVVLLLALLAYRATTSAAVDADRYHRAEAAILEVVEGDYLRVEVAGEAVLVRLLGVDANGRDDARAMARELCGDRVTLSLADVPTRDAAGVLVAYAHAGGRLVNAELVAAGVAFAERRCDHPHSGPFRLAEESAAARRLGMWAALDDDLDPPMPAWRSRWLAELRKPPWERGEWRVPGEY